MPSAHASPPQASAPAALFGWLLGVTAAALIALGWIGHANRRLRHLLGVAQDALQVAQDELQIEIEDRRKVEIELRNTTESLTVAQTSAGVATFDIDVLQDTIFCSDNYFEFLAIPETSRASDRADFLARVHPDDIDTVMVPEHGKAGNATTYKRDYRIVLDNGQIRWMSEKGNVTRGVSNQVTRIVGAIIDLTDLKSAQAAAVEAARSAEAASRAKSEFLANMSHEIRTPMNGVIGMTQILSETALEPTQREYVDIIAGSAAALMTLLNDVLDLSKIEAERLELEHVEFDVRHVIYQTLAPFALQSAAKGLELVCTVRGEVPVLVRGDPGRVRQIIMNLVANAIKFTHEGYVELCASSSAGADGRATLRIEISDSGIGIPHDRLDRLFKTFSQIDSSTTRHYGGSGLGLSIVRKLAHLMGGEAGVESESGKGSTFWVTVQLDALTRQPGPQPGSQPLQVLVVDDLRPSRESLAYKLRLFGHHVAAAASVEQALTLFEEGRRFDVVLADESMPARGGLELLVAMRAQAPHARTPVVLLSLFGSDSDRSSWPCLPDAVAMKPIRGVALAALLAETLAGTTRVSEAQPPASVSDERLRGRRMLLVEDNPVNQRVAQRMLEKMGAYVTIANNGAEALERVTESQFDAVLMDCQMPVMDGMSATRAIRALERRRGSVKRLPIIALTANVMSEDRENCMAAGMDAHLGKPVDPSQLVTCLARYLTVVGAALPVDWAALREVTGDDADFQRELIDTFISSGDQCFAEIVDALRLRDFDTIGRRAHALKGASANMQAHRLSAAASNLERAACKSSTSEVDGLVHELSETLQAVNAQFRSVG